MNIIKKFKVFEKMGISESSLMYVEFILKEYKDILEKFLSSNDNEVSESREYLSDDLLHIKKRWGWKEFPISSMEVEYTITKKIPEEFDKKFTNGNHIKDYIGTGACYSIGTKEDGGSYIREDSNQKTLHLKLNIGSILRGELSNIDGLLFEMESSISHELNHAFEFWKREVGGKSGIDTKLTYALDANRSKVSKEIFSYWHSEIGTLIYWSEEHEIRAMVQDSLGYVRKYSVEDMKDKCPSWEASSRMINFNSKKFRSDIIRLVNDKYGDRVDPEILLSRMKNSLSNEMRDQEIYLKDLKQDKPSLSGERIRKMSLDKFFEYAQRRINNAGRMLRKRILKLYSLKNTETNEIIF
jgi:hypothetical protein